MDTLTPEIVHFIFHHLDTSLDICNFRLTCKAFSAIGLYHLVPRLTLITLPKAFSHLSTIANHPAIRTSVKELVLLSNKLPEFEDIVEFENSAYRQYPGGPWVNKPAGLYAAQAVAEKNGERWTYDDRQENWRKYNEIRVQQQDREFTDTYEQYYNILREAFTKLPNLRSIHVRPSDRDTNGLRPCLHQWPDYKILPIKPTGQLPSVSHDTNADIELIFRALHATKTQHISHLSVSDLSPLFFSPSSPIFSGLSQALQHLRLINLEMDPAMNSRGDPFATWNEWTQCLSKGGFNQFLSSAPQLESIRIIFPQFSLDDHLTSLSSMFGDTVWSRLSRLELGSVQTTSEDFITFMQNHARTLKELKLTSLNLMGQDFYHWYTIFMRLSEVLSLRHASFGGCFEAELSEFQDCEYANMNNEIQGIYMVLGDAVGTLLCYSPLETEQVMYNETFEDLLKRKQKRLTSGMTAEITVRHPYFLRSLGEGGGSYRPW